LQARGLKSSRGSHFGSDPRAAGSRPLQETIGGSYGSIAFNG